MSNVLSVILAIISTGFLGILIYLINKYGENLFDKIIEFFIIVYLYILVPLCFIIIFYVIFISI